MFGIVIFYPAGQPIRNRSGAEKCRMHGVPCFAAFPAKKPIRVKIRVFSKNEGKKIPVTIEITGIPSVRRLQFGYFRPGSLAPQCF